MGRVVGKKSLICGHGVNDSEEPVTYRENGKKFRIKTYSTWAGMIHRCYSKSFKDKFQTYKDCTCSDNWLIYSNFKSWMDENNWEGRHLDKDLLGNGKLYSPETCCFLTPKANNYLKYDSKRKIPNLPTGVYLDKNSKKKIYYSQVKLPISGRRFRSKNSDDINQTFNWWVKHKRMGMQELISEENCPRIIRGMRDMYSDERLGLFRNNTTPLTNNEIKQFLQEEE